MEFLTFGLLGLLSFIGIGIAIFLLIFAKRKIDKASSLANEAQEA
jgi:hypothetical protein